MRTVPKCFLVAAAIALGCSELTAPTAILEGVKPYDNAALFAERWTMMESCSGLRGDLSRVTFYTATRIVSNAGTDVRGYWRESDNAIFILASLRDNTTAIEHEETHALLRGGANHPHEYFIDGPCGNLMLP